MDNPLIPGSNNAELEENLKQLPEIVADDLLKWRRAKLERERTEALLFLEFKVRDAKRTVAEIEAMVKSNDARYKAGLEEATAEANYQRAYEKLMTTKHLSHLRTAF